MDWILFGGIIIIYWEWLICEKLSQILKELKYSIKPEGGE